MRDTKKLLDDIALLKKSAKIFYGKGSDGKPVVIFAILGDDKEREIGIGIISPVEDKPTVISGHLKTIGGRSVDGRFYAFARLAAKTGKFYFKFRDGSLVDHVGQVIKTIETYNTNGYMSRRGLEISQTQISEFSVNLGHNDVLATDGYISNDEIEIDFDNDTWYDADDSLTKKISDHIANFFDDKNKVIILLLAGSIITVILQQFFSWIK